MNAVEQIRSYVERTKVKDGYSLSLGEIQALFYMAKDDPVDALVLAFKFGEAKRERYVEKMRRYIERKR